MAVGVQLSELLDQLKFESGQSANVAHGVSYRDALVYFLQRTQNELWTQHVWPHLSYRSTVDINAGQAEYNYPAGVDFESVRRLSILVGGEWMPVEFAITDDMLALYDLDDTTQRSSPVRAWEHNGAESANNQFRIWPRPDVAQKLRIHSQRKLGPLVQNTDTCTLDSTLIVLFAAAEILADRKSEAAPLKLQKAKDHMRMLKSRQNGLKSTPFQVGADNYGGGNRLRPGLDYIPQKG